jgi:signal transduction histidine kinase
LELNRSPVQLNDWLANILSPWEAAARQKGLTWFVDITPNLPKVMIDPDRMAQAMGNIISNAVKFTPAGGQVSTMVRMQDDQLSVQVTDTGLSIPENEREKIFEPFYRGNQGRRIVEGMGLGLSIARDIVSAHGGEIKVASPPEGGSTFVLQIPVEVPPEP